MGDALWLFASTPQWFVLGTGELDYSALGAIPLLGLVALVVGVALALIKREKRLIAFLVPFLASQLLLVLAGLSRGRVLQGTAEMIVYVFLGLQVLLAIVLMWRFRDALLAAAALAIFSLCYALFAAFVALNAMANTFL